MKKALVFSIFLLSLFSTQLTAQDPTIKWWYDVLDSGFGSAAAEDLDNDGKLEIIFGCYRNDSMVYVLNAENGSLAWKRNLAGDFEGCNDVAPIIYDVDQDGYKEAVVPASCNPKTFCFNGETGETKWVTPLHGSDSPPTISDIDNDGKPEILHGNFGGSVTCLNGEDGSIVFDLMVDPTSWIQTAPAIMDADNDGNLDFVVGASSFNGPDRIFCYRANNQELLWESDIATDDFYHGASFADLDGDDFMELVIGCYDGNIYCLNAEDGSEHWTYAFPTFSFYTPMATSIADLNDDGFYEITFFDYDRIGVLSHEGELLWEFEMASLGQCFRGAAISDVTGDGQLDVVFGSSNGILYALHGVDGEVAFEVDLAAHYGDPAFDLDHGPVIADFDDDGYMDIFVVGGYTTFPDFQQNYGRAYAISTNSPGGPDWLMFRRDSVRSGRVPIDLPTSVDQPEVDLLNLSLSPNPNSGQVSIQFELEEASEVEIQLLNLQGQVLHQEAKSKYLSGRHQVEWTAPANLSKGVYLLQVQTDFGNSVEKFVLSF